MGNLLMQRHFYSFSFYEALHVQLLLICSFITCLIALRRFRLIRESLVVYQSTEVKVTSAYFPLHTDMNTDELILVQW